MKKNIQSAISKPKAKISKSQSLRALIIEDSEDDALLIIRELEKGGYNPVYERVETASAMKKALQEKQWDIILCDYSLPKFNALSALTILKETNIDIPLIIVSGTIGEETAVEGMRLGAQDYLMKNNLSRLCPAIARELEETKVRNKHKQAEEALRLQSEIITNMSEGVNVIRASDKKIIYTNPRFDSLFGYEQGKLIGKSVAILNEDTSEKTAQEIADSIEKAVIEKGEFLSEILNRRKDGSSFWCLAHVSTYQHPEYGQVYISVHSDITERKRLGETLEKERKELKLIIDSSPIIVFYKDKEGRFIRVNRTFAETLNMPEENFPGKTVFDLYSPRIAQGMTDDDQEVFQSRRPKLNIIEQYESASGIRLVQTDKIPICDNHGVPIALIGFAQDITERKRTEEALRKSEESFRLSLDDSPLGVRIATAEGETLYANRAILDIYGYGSIEELKRIPLKERYTPESYAEFQIRKEKRGRGEFGPSEYKISIVRKNGKVRHVQVFRKEVWWNGARQFQIIYQDITERKQAEEALRRSEEKYRNIIENMQESYYELDMEGNFTLVNDKVVRDLGYTKEELIGTNSRRYRDGKNEKEIYQRYNELYKTGETIRALEVVYVSKNGTARTYELTASLIRDEQGKPIGFRGISRDITERKRMEEQLRHSQQELQALMDNSPIGICWADMQGNIQYINRKFLALFGYTVEDIPNIAAWRSLAYPSPAYREQVPSLIGLLTKAQKQGKEADSLETTITCKDGSTRHVLQAGAVTFNRILVTYDDITERKQAETSLRESEEKYRLVVENTKEAIIITQDMKLVFANRAAADMTGYSEEILKSKTFTDFIHPDDRNMVVEYHIKRLAGEEIPSVYSFRIISQDGTVMWAEHNAVVITWKERPATLNFLNDITERKQAEEALRASELRYRILFEASADGILIADFETQTFKYSNTALCRMLGYTEEELRTLGLADIHPKQDLQRVIAEFETLVCGDKNLVLDIPCLRKDGGILYVDINSTNMTIDGKSCVVGIFRDITERKRMEEVLKTSEERFRTAAESLTDVVYDWDIKEKVDWYGDIDGIMGYPPGGFPRTIKGWEMTIHPEDKDRVMAALEDHLKGVAPFVVEYRVGRRDGEWRWWSARGTALRDDRGEPCKMIGSITDITKRKRTEESLRESEERYKALFDRSLDIVFICDFEGRIIDANATALNQLGYTREDIHSLNFASFLSEDQLPLAFKIIQEIQETGIQKDLAEFRLRHKNGSEVYVETHGSIIMTSGKPVAIQQVARDITERKRTEEESKQSVERMRKALRATVQAISRTVEMKDPYTSGHQQRVSDLAWSMAKEMGLSADRQDFIRTASSIHDIGKIAIPSEILSKPTKLTDLEFRLIKTHAQSGYDILKDIEFPWAVADVVLQHHERMDGSGYPQGLKGDDTLLEARILAIADVVEAIASHRPYRPAMGLDLALEEISRNKGTLYDADAVDACLKLFQEKGYTLV